ncbi:hypothetical protein L13192_02008 [Pyrenophora tritici-repentis]|uniref:ABM domain-containing protein n=1 Tax=Pyrenophora tritici-repentis (strain Pt-1C-BFP) TaxID=426418 RepID=B2VQK5_PYRTR|nr:uncharacterized protein PTRG_00483 [Pyrenophora tritici-repentis Pt-1C-BFP]EDU39921.1 conserved hypothetical protein [Pyrenophora tritici-repentis Pt-1C-BFP]KAI1675261.1 hypothetical protein L13192_02008 [Pyrenophora tritici-repentis]KAI1687586.1 hypothetical protein KJE20_00763 [Pyrenophora tritici-repentis]
MTITEIALLRLYPTTSLVTPDLRSKLAHAATVMRQHTSRPVYYLQQIEDPSYIYIITEWESLASHMEDFIPSPANQNLLQSLQGLLTVEWLWHIETPLSDLPLPVTQAEAEVEAAVNGQRVWSLIRHVIKADEKHRFQGHFDTKKGYLQDFVTEGNIGGGWRVDGEGGKDEFVLICPWKSVEQHVEFGKTEGFGEYARIRECVEEVDIRHGMLLDI